MSGGRQRFGLPRSTLRLMTPFRMGKFPEDGSEGGLLAML